MWPHKHDCAGFHVSDVVAYVEVRTANDNRSAAVKRVLERMGARVQEKFSDDVTHVIFKEGKKRTKDKAQKLRVHLVSVLWVDRYEQGRKIWALPTAWNQFFCFGGFESETESLQSCQDAIWRGLGQLGVSDFFMWGQSRVWYW